MPKGIHLNDFQKDQIVAYKNGGKCIRGIARILHISSNTASNILRQLDREEKEKKTGRQEVNGSRAKETR